MLYVSIYSQPTTHMPLGEMNVIYPRELGMADGIFAQRIERGGLLVKFKCVRMAAEER